MHPYPNPERRPMQDLQTAPRPPHNRPARRLHRSRLPPSSHPRPSGPLRPQPAMLLQKHGTRHGTTDVPGRLAALFQWPLQCQADWPAVSALFRLSAVAIHASTRTRGILSRLGPSCLRCLNIPATSPVAHLAYRTRTLPVLVSLFLGRYSHLTCVGALAASQPSVGVRTDVVRQAPLVRE